MISTMPLTQRALVKASELHEGQFRKGSGLPYIVHPVEVYSIVKKFKESHNIDNICAAALLHDTVEDCNYTLEDVKSDFNEMIASLVSEVTSDPLAIQKVGKEAYLNEKLSNLTSYALVIKLSDILANLTDQPTFQMIRRIRKHHTHVINSGRILSNTHKVLLSQIDLALTGLYQE